MPLATRVQQELDERYRFVQPYHRVQTLCILRLRCLQKWSEHHPCLLGQIIRIVLLSHTTLPKINLMSLCWRSMHPLAPLLFALFMVEKLLLLRDRKGPAARGSSYKVIHLSIPSLLFSAARSSQELMRYFTVVQVFPPSVVCRRNGEPLLAPLMA